MPSPFESSEQFGRPDPSNKVDHGRKEAKKGSTTPKGASFKQGPLETPVSGGSFKDRTAVNDLSAKGFKQKGHTGV